ncbi:MAG: Spy/CpxP family protein refolding chaperone [Gemmatimonadaceae bacterium]
MRNSRLVVLVVAALASTASFASAQAARADSAGVARAGRDSNHRARGELLRGVTLTEAEKGKLKELHGRNKEETKSLRESLKPAMKEARTARQKGDTAAARAVLERTKADREKLHAVMQHQKADVRAALTPEHQKQFDANVKQVSERRRSAKKGRGGKGHIGGRQKKMQTPPNS